MKLLELIFVSANDLVLGMIIIFILATIAMDLIDYDSIIIRFFKLLNSLFSKK